MTISIPNDGLRGLAPVEPRGLTGKILNVQHQRFHGFMGGASYELAIVEFDDQGQCFDRGQMDGVATRIDQLRATETDVILLVFTHGWRLCENGVGVSSKGSERRLWFRRGSLW